mgnify:CR=1 FL=1
MKNLLMTFLAFAMISSAVAQQINSKNFSYIEGVEFNIKRFNSAKTTEFGNGDGRTYIAQGARFKTAWMEFTNSTEQDVEIDFSQFNLIDSNSNRYHPNGVVQGGKFTNTRENYKLKLKAGKTKLFLVEFWPPYPKDEPITRLVVNENIITLQ